ncbi:MAG: transcriptional regulator [Anaerolineae bacterium]|nr:transcriptional regulator [Anaerolineae bacterium]
MSHAAGRTQTLRILESKWYERAWTDQELADDIGVARSTIYKDRQLLLNDGVPFVEIERGRWRIDRKQYLSHIRLNRYAATQAYTLAKRMARQMHTPDPHAISLLKDLAFTLRQPLMDRLLRVTQLIPQGTADPKKAAIFEKVVDGWLDGRILRIGYRGLQAQQATVHRVHPFLIEPSPWNESIYLIGFSETFGKVLTFKLDRIETAVVMMQPIELPEAFDEHQLLQLAWGIWHGDSAETVRLCFKHGPATRRLRETKWHPTEDLTDCDNGDVIWEAQIADWREMLPWIRGWGADCVVLEPKILRRTLEREVMGLMDCYGIKGDFNTISEDDDDAWAEALFGGDT